MMDIPVRNISRVEVVCIMRRMHASTEVDADDTCIEKAVVVEEGALH
jgi:hypothetical protein